MFTIRLMMSLGAFILPLMDLTTGYGSLSMKSSKHFWIAIIIASQIAKHTTTRIEQSSIYLPFAMMNLAWLSLMTYHTVANLAEWILDASILIFIPIFRRRFQDRIYSSFYGFLTSTCDTILDKVLEANNMRRFNIIEWYANIIISHIIE